MARRFSEISGAAALLTVNNFAARFAQLGKAHAVNEFHDCLQCRVDHWLAGTDDGKTQHRALPKILVVAFSDCDVKLIRYPRLNTLNDPAFAFEGVILG